MHDYAARDLLDSGVLKELSNRFELSFVSTRRLTLNLKKFGSVYYYSEPIGFRLRIVQLARGLFHMSDKSKYELNRRQALARATFGLGDLNSRLIKYLSAMKLSRLIATLIRIYLRLTFRETLPENNRPDAMLVYTSVSSYFADDMVREAKRKSIPLLALTNNWDNLNTKSFFEKPPYLGVWGEQGFLIARLMHLIPSHRIFLIGAPRFEFYRKQKYSRAESRAALVLPENSIVLLFCGAGVAFEETSLLVELEDAIEHGRLPADTIVLYKPHPLRFKRSNEKTLDFNLLKHIKLLKSEQKLTNLDIYPHLMGAADALISPFSTMVIEGARAGLPALCLGYSDEGHYEHDWNRAAFNLHLYIVRHGDWAIVCDHRQSFLQSCQRLIDLCGDEVIAQQARYAADMVFAFRTQSVSQRIDTALKKIIVGNDADDSFLLSKI